MLPSQGHPLLVDEGHCQRLVRGQVLPKNRSVSGAPTIIPAGPLSRTPSGGCCRLISENAQQARVSASGTDPAVEADRSPSPHLVPT